MRNENKSFRTVIHIEETTKIRNTLHSYADDITFVKSDSFRKQLKIPRFLRMLEITDTKAAQQNCIPPEYSTTKWIQTFPF